jgi:Flp pilus assembly protein TadB
MTITLLLGACALACWPTAPDYWALRRSQTSPAPLRSWLDRLVPALLGSAVLVLGIASKPTTAGIALSFAAAAGTFVLLRRLRNRSAPQTVDGALPLVLTVAALLLRSGTPPGTALAAAARSCRSTSRIACEQVERRISMGEPPLRAWSALGELPELAAVGRAAVRAADSGAALANAWESTSDRLRADRRLAAEVRARKVGIRVLAPLGLCFLPSFICLGVVPMVIGLAGDVL